MQQRLEAPRIDRSQLEPFAHKRNTNRTSQVLQSADSVLRSIDAALERQTQLHRPSVRPFYDVPIPLKQPEQSSQSVIEAELKELTGLQRSFDFALGRSYDPIDLLQRSYNPVIDVLHIKQLQRSGDAEGERKHMDEITLNMETNLRERYKVSKSVIDYHMNGGRLYSQHFPHEPFGKVLERGVEYRLQHNTPEPEREGVLGEQSGWAIIENKLTDPKTKIGSKMTAFSPPGLAENTAYTGKFIDEYELAENKLGERYVKLTRYAVKFDEAEYASAALSLDPHYFKGYDGRPKDAWMLAHPLEGSLNIQEDQINVKADFVPDLKSGKLLSFLNYYKDALGEEPIDWKKIALTFNAFLNQSDEEREAYEKSGKVSQHGDIPVSIAAIKSEIYKKGMQQVRTVVGGGCPPNKGFSITNSLNTGSSISVREPGTAQFSVFSKMSTLGEKTVHCNECPNCKEKDIDAKVMGGRIICPKNGCSAPYAC